MGKSAPAVPVRTPGAGSVGLLQNHSRRTDGSRETRVPRAFRRRLISAVAIIDGIDEPVPPGIAPGLENLSNQWTKAGGAPRSFAHARTGNDHGGGRPQRLRENHPAESCGRHGFSNIGRGTHRWPRHQFAKRGGVDGAAANAYRICVSIFSITAGADHAGECRASAAARHSPAWSAPAVIEKIETQIRYAFAAAPSTPPRLANWWRGHR